MTDGTNAADHAIGRLRLPEGVGVIAGSPNGARRAVGIVRGQRRSVTANRSFPTGQSERIGRLAERDGVSVVAGLRRFQPG